jgi:TatD DNase family protein
MIDSHCHLYLCKEPIEEILSRCEQHGLSDLIQVATDSENAIWGKELANKHSKGVSIHPTAGLYPSRAEGPWEEQLELLSSELNSGAYVAVGEMGIDLYHDKSYLERQLAMFHAQVPLALKNDLPMILHIRNSYHEVRSALSDYEGEKAMRGVWHCFEGKAEEAVDFVELGWMISFSGLLTYKKRDDLREVAREVPLKNLMIETDSPYLSPVPLRHEKNEPWKVSYVLECLADVKEMAPSELEKVLNENTRRFFGLEKN